MITGRKVMHLQNMESFEFLPGESLILPSYEIMCIDFPDASRETPTSCSAMAISQDKIAEVVNVMNDSLPRADGKEWEFMDFNYRFTNDAGIYQLIQRLFFLFTENHSSRDIFVDFMLKELIIRVLRSNYQEQYSNNLLQQTGDERIMDAIRFIRKHLDEPISIQKLSRVACMSESNFHRVFKEETGSSPVEFINNERIRRAAALLRQPGVKIKEVIHMCGFDSRSYFNRVFKQRYEMTPGAYQSGMSGAVVN
jgi:AraC-like DNA-binding protein